MEKIVHKSRGRKFWINFNLISEIAKFIASSIYDAEWMDDSIFDFVHRNFVGIYRVSFLDRTPKDTTHKQITY